MMQASEYNVRRRPDLTFKFNTSSKRHGWLRLTPAYSVKLVEKILPTPQEHLAVIDPFSGTATTALCASSKGHQSTCIDINPFLVWLGSVKTDIYEEEILALAKDCTCRVISSIRNNEIDPADAPPLSNIERWWADEHLAFLRLLKASIDTCTDPGSQVQNLLYVAFCRTLIELSNAAFNHQSMSFKTESTNKQRTLWQDDDFHVTIFQKNVSLVLEGAENNPHTKADVLLGDSREVEVLVDKKYDILVTSPPYPNRISYIRELRPYMYWLGYLNEAREAGELDWQAIGGTWGIATSRLSEWDRKQAEYLPSFLRKVLCAIENSNGKSGLLLSNYVGKYFDDMWKHIRSVSGIMKPGGVVHYIVGNSKFYDVLVPTERIYHDMLESAGFRDVVVKVVRKRNSKKELFEFDVSR